ncbi:histidine kinase [Ketobacter sp. MCCC 1A13808]|uniref:histidine kinase n=1 Tax=Ketobacter sp. MCCC 1A13808 TaxID=2602738 RepID=UPI000F260E3C|nr:histidine kinase [Ketobacter sp. MCCC 1A13808]MVF10761.1 histidine kinase [Ketobacter sp. MCCC 1A13808]RLP56174.1 MAG: histidine kinase [Ketobacter sp.]
MNTTLALSEDQRDCLQEVVNVAMGQAGDSLARFLEVFIHLSVPRIRLVSRDKLNIELESMVGGHQVTVSGVSQGFYQLDTGSGIRGEAIVVFTDSSFKELADLLAYDEQLTPATEKELLLDVTNILNGACLNGIGQQMEVELGFSPPNIMGQHLPIAELLEQEATSWDHALLVEISYTLEDRSFSCTMFLLMPGDSIQVVKTALDRLLEDL